jgi:hypothetical protein
MKLKDWNFVKNQTKRDLKMVLAEEEIRAREEGKDSAFIRNDCLIPPPTMEGVSSGKSSKNYFAPRANRGKYH